LKPDLTINLSREREFTEHLRDPGLIERLCLGLKGPRPLIVIDEVQRIPSILNSVQSLIDDHPQLHFLLSGSSARKLSRGKANLLPGRVISEKLFPLTFWEMKDGWSDTRLKQCLIRGTLPGIVDSDLADDILEAYVDIYLREEIQAEALTKDLGDYVRFLDVAAGASGQYINYSKMASDTEINKEKIRRFSQILSDTLLIHRVEAFDQVSLRRKVRQKDRFIFFDNGVRNAILRKNRNQFSATDLGPLFESWLIQQTIAFVSYNRKPWRISSYRDDRDIEVDLVIETNSGTHAFEIKYQERFRPDFSENLMEFEKLLGRKKLHKYVVYTGTHVQRTQDGIEILPYKEFLNRLPEF
jgi:predicted AAA+ superfamily ATPase